MNNRWSPCNPTVGCVTWCSRFTYIPVHSHAVLSTKIAVHYCWLFPRYLLLSLYYNCSHFSALLLKAEMFVFTLLSNRSKEYLWKKGTLYLVSHIHFAFPLTTHSSTVLSWVVILWVVMPLKWLFQSLVHLHLVMCSNWFSLNLFVQRLPQGDEVLNTEKGWDKLYIINISVWAN